MQDAFHVYRDIIDKSGISVSSARTVFRIIRMRRWENKSGAIKSKRITKLTGYSGVKIRAIVQMLRNVGCPICSGSKGYWFDPIDITETINHLHTRAMSLLETESALKAGAVDRSIFDLWRDTETIDYVSQSTIDMMAAEKKKAPARLRETKKRENKMRMQFPDGGAA